MSAVDMRGKEINGLAQFLQGAVPCETHYGQCKVYIAYHRVR